MDRSISYLHNKILNFRLTYIFRLAAWSNIHFLIINFLINRWKGKRKYIVWDERRMQAHTKKIYIQNMSTYKYSWRKVLEFKYIFFITTKYIRKSIFDIYFLCRKMYFSQAVFFVCNPLVLLHTIRHMSFL